MVNSMFHQEYPGKQSVKLMMMNFIVADIHNCLKLEVCWLGCTCDMEYCIHRQPKSVQMKIILVKLFPFVTQNVRTMNTWIYGSHTHTNNITLLLVMVDSFSEWTGVIAFLTERTQP